MEKNEIKIFYDGFTERLLNDFLRGNPRVLSAIEFSVLNIPVEVKRILDIGCGIGWSSYELARHFPGCSVLGIDLSPRLIQRAGHLFSMKNLRFLNLDVTSQEFKLLVEGSFDVIVMVDVFEHLDMHTRQDFYQTIASMLNKNGRVLMAFPSPAHLEWYKRYDPDKLQPVDNNVTLADLQDFAKQVKGAILHYEHKAIWNEYDYIHAIIKMGEIGYRPDGEYGYLRRPNLLSSFQRAKLVKKAYPSAKISLIRQFVKSLLKAIFPFLLKRENKQR